jgi:uncharacterized protein YbbK (DUF523 family)
MSNQSQLDSITHPSVRLGISSCLLGEKVRFNGGHVKDSFLLDTLGRYVEWVPVCPPSVSDGDPKPYTVALTYTDPSNI